MLSEAGTPSGDAVSYGLANWDFYNGNLQSAKHGYNNILDNPSWSSFGYIAAEQDYLKYYATKQSV